MRSFYVLGILLCLITLLAIVSSFYIGYGLPNLGPAPLLKLQQDSLQIARGAYLANHVTVCMGCHSQRDWSLFSAPLVKGTEGRGGEFFSRTMGFPGEFYAPNISPTQLEKWSDGEIYRAITHGVAKDGRALYPIMAYARFGKMDPQDTHAIILYLRSLRPQQQRTLPAPQFDFPINILNNLGPHAPQAQQRPDPDDRIAYGAYLVNAAGCMDCHTDLDVDQFIKGKPFAGGKTFQQANGILLSSNITADPHTGIGSWSEEQFIKRFKDFEKSSAKELQLMPDAVNSPMPWQMYAGMTVEDLSAIYQYLRSLPSVENNIEKQPMMLK